MKKKKIIVGQVRNLIGLNITVKVFKFSVIVHQPHISEPERLNLTGKEARELGELLLTASLKLKSQEGR